MSIDIYREVNERQVERKIIGPDTRDLVRFESKSKEEPVRKRQLASANITGLSERSDLLVKTGRWLGEKFPNLALSAAVLASVWALVQKPEPVYAQNPNQGTGPNCVDINGDGITNNAEITAMAGRYYLCPYIPPTVEGCAGWEKFDIAPPSPLGPDGQVNLYDLVVLAGHYGMPCTNQIAESPSRSESLPEGYQTVEQYYQEYNELARQYSGVVRVLKIGESWLKTQGRDGSDLLVLHLGTNSELSARPAMLVECSDHAREILTTEIGMKFVRELLASYGTDPHITALLNNRSLIVYPMANPDGRKEVENGFLWRKNANDSAGAACSRNPTNEDGNDPHPGVNFSRNWPVGFDQGYSGDNDSEKDPCGVEYAGEYPLSEPETSAVYDLAQGLWPTGRGVFFNVHSGSDASIIGFPEPNYGLPFVLKMEATTGFPDIDFLLMGTPVLTMQKTFGATSMVWEFSSSRWLQPMSEVDAAWEQVRAAWLYALTVADNPNGYDGFEVTRSSVADSDGSIKIGWGFKRSLSGSINRVEVYLDVAPENGGLPISVSSGGESEIVIPKDIIPPGRHVVIIRGGRYNSTEDFSWGPWQGIGFVQK